MRSKRTNILQVIVLITGITYIVIGLFYYVNPLIIFRIFAENVAENWFDLVRENELVGPLYSILRAFAALVFTAGVTQVMPLFDPLKYRMLIYFNGLLFPFMSCVVLLSHAVHFFIRQRGTEALGRGSLEGVSNHAIISILIITFLAVLIINIVGLLITKKEAARGQE